METRDLLIREKLNNVYSEIFEKELLEEIIKVCYFKKIKSGELLINIGDVLTHIPLLTEGVVKIIRMENEGDEIALYYLEPGDTCAISFANCIKKERSIFKGIVEKDVEALFIPVNNIDEWLVKYKSWRYYIIDSYHFRLIEMVESIDNLAFLQLNDRLMKYLIGKVKMNNTKDLEITHQDIASDLNTSRVVVSRIIKQLHDENKIYSTRNKVRVL